MWSTEKDSDVHCIYCNFLDLIAFHSGSLEDIVCFSLLLLFFARSTNLQAYGFLNIFQFNIEDRIQWLMMLPKVTPPSHFIISLKPIAYIVWISSELSVFTLWATFSTSRICDTLEVHYCLHSCHQWLSKDLYGTSYPSATTWFLVEKNVPPLSHKSLYLHSLLTQL